MKRPFASIATTLGLVLLASPAFAGNVTLINTATSGTWHFSIECFTASGESSGVTLGKLDAGNSIEEGNTGCETFTLKFSSTNGDKENYKLQAGKRYKYFWNVNHWDLEPDNEPRRRPSPPWSCSARDADPRHR